MLGPKLTTAADPDLVQVAKHQKIAAAVAEAAQGFVNMNIPAAVPSGSETAAVTATPPQPGHAAEADQDAQGPDNAPNSGLEIIGHSVNKTQATVTFKVQHIGTDEIMFVKEAILQNRDEQLVLNYWASLGDRNVATGLTERFWVRDVIGHRLRRRYANQAAVKKKGQAIASFSAASYEYQVQWVGFSNTGQDVTWHSANFLMDCAKEIIMAYLEEQGLA